MAVPRVVPIAAVVGAVALAMTWTRVGGVDSGASPSDMPRSPVAESPAALPQSSRSVENASVQRASGSDVAPELDTRSAVAVDGEFPDPTVLSTPTGYVAYSTNITVAGALLNVPARVSADLTSWSPVVDVLPELPSWAEPGQTWAPSAITRNGRHELYFSALDRSSGLQCIGVATSDGPLGPFVSTDQRPLVCSPALGGAIDPEVVVVSGTTYLLWKNDGNCCDVTVRLWAQELSGTSLVGTATALLVADASWEHGVIENPTLVVQDDRIVLLYSGGHWNTDRYGTGYAICADLRTACTKRSRSGPAYDDVQGTTGNGGASAFRAADGTTWLTWHVWDETGAHGASRSMRLAPLR